MKTKKTSLILILTMIGLFLSNTEMFAQQAADQLYEKALYLEEAKGEMQDAINIYNKIVETRDADQSVKAKALLHTGLCYEKLGMKEATKAYQRLVNTFPNQTEMVALAKARLAALGGSGGTGRLVTRRILADASGVSGVLTPDGKYISHLDNTTGDVIQFEVASGQKSRITNRGPAYETGDNQELPVYSRDGKQIAYASYTKENDGDPQLRIRNLDGSGLRTLYSQKSSDAYPLDWSPDAGSILAFRELDNNLGTELILISTADGSVRVLRSITSPLFWFERASFSPDGQIIAFSFVREGNPPQGGIFLMTADGRNEVVVAAHPAEDRLLRWTPDGKSLLFLSDRSGTWDIWSVRITGGKQQGEPELLRKDFGYDSEVLGFAPNGSFYYKNQTYSGRLYKGALDLETGKVLVPPAHVTTRYTGPPHQLTWSSDGRNLAYLSRRGWGLGNRILTINSTATGEERLLSLRLRFVSQISWAPDGRSILAVGITGTEMGIFRIDAETGDIKRLADIGLGPKLCPDGKTLVFLNNARFIRKRNLDTGEVSEVVDAGRGGNEQMWYDLSPDGREVVFQVDGAVKTVSLNGGEPRELFRGLAQYYDLRWTRDGRYIIAKSYNPTSSEIWRVPAQGGTPLKLDLSISKMESFALHPDNSLFAFSVNEESKSELWVLENFLPKEETINKQK